MRLATREMEPCQSGSAFYSYFYRVLHWQMGSQTQFIFKQSLVYGVGNTLSKLSGVLLLPLYVVFTTPAEFGLLALFETIYQFVLVLSGWGAKSGFSRFYYEMTTERKRQTLFFTIFSFTLVTSFLAVCAVGGLLWKWSFPVFQTEVSSMVLAFFLTSTLARLMFDVPFILLRLQQKAIRQTTHQGINIVVTIALTYLFLKVGKMGFKGIFLAQMVANLFTFTAILPEIYRNTHPRVDWRVLRESIHYGYPLAISNILTIALALSDRHLLNQFQNLQEVGNYSMAYKISSTLQAILVTSFLTSYTFYYYKSLEDHSHKELHLKVFRYFVLAMVFLGFGLVAFRREAVWMVSFGRDTYQEALPMIPVLLLGLILLGLRQIFTLPLTKLKMTRTISSISIGVAVINVGLNIWLIPHYGKLAAAYTGVVSHLLGCVISIVVLKRAGEGNYPLGFLVRSIGLFVGLSAISLALPFWGWGYNVAVALGLCVAMALTFWLFGFAGKAEWMEAKRLILQRIKR